MKERMNALIWSHLRHTLKVLLIPEMGLQAQIYLQLDKINHLPGA